MEDIKELLNRLSNYLVDWNRTKNANFSRKLGEVICKIILLNSANLDTKELSKKTKLQELIDAISKRNLTENENHLKKIKSDLNILQDFGNLESHDNDVEINAHDIEKISKAVDGLIRNVFDSKDYIDIDEKIPFFILKHINKTISEEEDWRCEKIISLVYPNREPSKIHDTKGCQLYTIKDVNGNGLGFVFLGRNVSVLAEIKALFSANIDIKSLTSLTFLFPKEISKTTGMEVKNRKNNIINKSDSYQKSFTKTKFIYEFIEDYIWNYCLIDSLKSNSNISIEPYFIDQWLYHGNEKKISLALLDEIINHTSLDEKPIHIILGDGGVGKTTFCTQAIQKVDNLLSKGVKKKAILLSSFDLPDELSTLESTVDSIESLYKILQDNSDQTLNYQSLKLNISSGNILIIIDGLDEIESKLKERFNLDNFIKSVVELNDTFLNCSVIITSRCNSPEKFEHENINIYMLKGFDDDHVHKYLLKRFNKDESDYGKKALKHISELELNDNKKVTPLIIKLICELVENQGYKKLEEDCEEYKYFKLQDPLDKVINQIIMRDITIKQDINISCDDYFEILKDIVFDYNCLISKKDIDELIGYAFLMNGIGNVKDYANFYVSPLLLRQGDNFRIKYDSLEFWIKARYISYQINALQKETSDNVINILTRDCYKGGALAKEISKYIEKNDASYFISTIKKSCEKLLKDGNDAVLARKTISALLYIAMQNEVNERSHYSRIILSLFGKSEGEVIRYLSIYGDFVVLDFSLFTVLDGYFNGYSNLSKSAIPVDKTVFTDCEFKNIDTSLFGKQHIKDSNFKNCILPNDIKALINISEQTKHDKVNHIKSDLKKIFKVGFRQNSFQWKSEGLYRQQCASLKHKLVLSEYLSTLVVKKFLNIEEAKGSAGENGYRVNSGMEDIVKDFITQGITGNDFRQLIEELSE